MGAVATGRARAIRRDHRRVRAVTLLARAGGALRRRRARRGATILLARPRGWATVLRAAHPTPSGRARHTEQPSGPYEVRIVEALDVPPVVGLGMALVGIVDLGPLVTIAQVDFSDIEQIVARHDLIGDIAGIGLVMVITRRIHLNGLHFDRISRIDMRSSRCAGRGSGNTNGTERSRRCGDLPSLKEL